MSQTLCDKRRRARITIPGWVAVCALLALPGTAFGQPLPVLDCFIKPYVVVDVGTPVAGVIESLDVERNDLVRVGDVLARLKSDVEQATVALARARAEVDGRVASRRTALAFGERKAKRTEELYAKKAVPFQLKDEAETDARIARLKLQEAKEDRLIAKLELQRAIELLNQRTIRSPIAGVVVERMAFPGEFVDDAPILRLAQLDPLLVEVIIPVNMLGSIRTGMRARVSPEVAGSEPYTATVTSVDRVVDGSSGTFGVRLELRNPSYKLPGGLKCNVQMLDEPPPPRAAERAPEAPEQVTGVPPAPPRKQMTEAVKPAPVEQAPGRTAQAPAPPKALPVQPSTVSSTAPAAPSPRKPAAPPSVETVAAAAGPICRSLGPLPSAGRADKLTEVLAGRVTRVSRRVEGPTRVTRYMVVTPRQASTAQAKRLAEKLRKSGIQNPWVIPRGRLKDRVSLGLFLSKASAEKQRSEVGTRGIKVEIKPRHRAQTLVWLDVELPGSKLAGLQKTLQKTQPGLSLKPTACPSLKTAQN